MLLVFSHANSFPASTYKVLFKSLKLRGFIVKAIDKYGHDPKYPVSNNWPHRHAGGQPLVSHGEAPGNRSGD